jgi:hypothetical protein
MNQAFVQWELVLEDKKRLVLNAPFAFFSLGPPVQVRVPLSMGIRRGLHNTCWAAMNYLSLRNSIHYGDEHFRVIFFVL